MKPTSKRVLTMGLFSLVWTAVFVALYFASFRYPQLLKPELFTQDWRAQLGRKTPVNEQLVLVGVDQPSYEGFFLDERKNSRAAELLSQYWPWSREAWGLVIDKLAQAGAKVVVVDFVFTTPGPGDDALKAVLEKHKDRVVIGCDITGRTTVRGGMFSLLWPSETILGTTGLDDDRVGYVNIYPDPDEIRRRAIYRLSHDQTGGLIPADQAIESLAVRTLQKAGYGNTVPEGFKNTLFRFTTYKEHQYEQVPVATLFVPKLWELNYGSGKFFRDKIVLVGPTANLFQDFHKTPIGTIPGPEYHLNLIGATIRGETINESVVWLDVVLMIAAGFFAWVLALGIRAPLRRAAFAVGIMVFYIVVCQFMYDYGNLMLFASTPVLVLGSGSLNIFLYDFVLERREKARVRKTLERYVSRDVVKELLDNPATFFNTLGGVRKPVTVLFSDVRGFTTLTESADSHALVKQLNEYFQEMVAHVFGHQGSLDKFIGDAVMAVWGSIVSQGPQKDALNAVATALAMKRSLKKLNEDWKARSMPELAFGIGINHGEVIVGNLGSSEKMELTVIGDGVNLASRLEGLTKEYHLDLLLGETVAPLVGDTYILRTVDSVQVKGKTKPVDVFTVMGDGAGQTVSMPMWLARYEDGVQLYRQRAFKEAAAAFEECVRRQPEDYLSSMYLKRCQALIDNPPDESWDGVFVMTKK